MNSTKSRIKTMIVERLFLPVDPSAIADDASLMETYDIDSVPSSSWSSASNPSSIFRWKTSNFRPRPF